MSSFPEMPECKYGRVPAMENLRKSITRKTKGNQRNCIICTVVLFMLAIVVATCIVFTRTSGSSRTSRLSAGFVALPSGDITFNPEDPSSYEEYVALLNRTIASYEQEAVTENMIDCTKRQPEPGEVCRFRDTWLNQCRKASLWGYKYGKPCIILTFSSDSDFMPEISGGPKKYPALMPEDLKEELEEYGAKVGVDCTNADVYNPFRVFNDYFFLHKNVTGYLRPLVAVRFDLSGRERLETDCKIWYTSSSESISASHSFRIKRSY